MNDFALHPNVYATGEMRGLVQMLERVWVRNHQPGDGTMYIVSGFGNYNGGVRFFDTFRHHVNHGGRVVSLFAGAGCWRVRAHHQPQAPIAFQVLRRRDGGWSEPCGDIR